MIRTKISKNEFTPYWQKMSTAWVAVDFEWSTLGVELMVERNHLRAAIHERAWSDEKD